MRLLNNISVSSVSNRGLWTALLLLVAVFVPSLAVADSGHGEDEGSKLDVKEIIFEHLGDGYGWEVPFSHTARIPCRSLSVLKTVAGFRFRPLA